MTEALIKDGADDSDLNPLFIGGVPTVRRKKVKPPKEEREETGSGSGSESSSSEEEEEVQLTKDQEDLQAANVAVVLRCRPMLTHEHHQGIQSVVKCDPRQHEVHVSGKPQVAGGAAPPSTCFLRACLPVCLHPACRLGLRP